MFANMTAQPLCSALTARSLTSRACCAALQPPAGASCSLEHHHAPGQACDTWSEQQQQQQQQQQSVECVTMHSMPTVKRPGRSPPAPPGGPTQSAAGQDNPDKVHQ
jgi:hypothetical protein